MQQRFFGHIKWGPKLEINLKSNLPPKKQQEQQQQKILDYNLYHPEILTGMHKV